MDDLLLQYPAVTSASRFMWWSTALLTVIIVGHWAWEHRDYRRPLIGIMMGEAAIFVHQAYYWTWWLSDAKAPPGLISIRWITSLAGYIAAVALVFIISPYLEARVGRWWWAAGFAMLAALWTTGYTIHVTIGE